MLSTSALATTNISFRGRIANQNFKPRAFYRKHFWCFPRLERRIYTCLLSVLLAHSCYDQYSLSCKDYEPCAFYRKHFWCFPRLERRIYTCILSVLLPHSCSYDQYSLSCKDYESCAFYRKHFWCFPLLERRIYTYILSVLLAHSCYDQYSLSSKDCSFNEMHELRIERSVNSHGLFDLV